MPIERFYVDQRLDSNSQVILKETEFHHLAHVMRMKTGDDVELINGRGALARGILTQLKKDQAYLSIESVYHEPESTKKIILAQGIPKPNRLDFILEKGTELGVSEFWLFPAQQSSRKEFNENQLDRMHSLTIAATKQCGRLYLPKLVINPVLTQWTTLGAPLFFGDLSPQAPMLIEALQGVKSEQELIFLTGPESGLTEIELEKLRSIGGIGVKLHGNVLRTDTASIMALSLISHIISSY